MSDNKLKVLILSAEVWRDDTNGGNVLSNVFLNTNFEFAQIFCNPGEPYNNLCKRYFQLTDSMMIKNLLKHTSVGKKLVYEDFPSKKAENNIAEQSNKKFYSFFRRYRFEIFNVIRSLIWTLASWKTNELKQFITDFNPDIIFAPCYASHFMLKLDRYVKEICNVPVVSYISDDNYGLKQFRLDPVYWIDRFILRHNMRKTAKIYDLVYTMTDEQKDEYQKTLFDNMKILRKSGDFENVPTKETVNSPIRIIYAGGVYCGRWKTLEYLSKTISQINATGKKLQLDIYTTNETTKRQLKYLDDKNNSFVHSCVSQEELKKIYLNSDVALHVESFELKYKLLTRLSFSTKIIDCMSSGCAVMAICDSNQAGFSYLNKTDSAICVSDLSSLKSVLENLVNNPQIINNYQIKAKEIGIKNHKQSDNTKMIIDDFNSLASKNKG